MVTDLHVAALHAYLTLDFDEQKRLEDRIEAEGSTGEMGLLMLASLAEAAVRTFGQPYAKADVIRFVARTRARASAELLDHIKVTSAERLLEASLGNADALEARTAADTEPMAVLLYALIEEQHLDSAALNEFLNAAKVRASRTLGR